jgi:peptide/nickel transport system ATP-binding protein
MDIEWPASYTVGEREVEQDQRTSAPPVTLELRHVSQYFRGAGRSVIVAAEDINLTINQGEVLALVGESGSGKTTIGRVSVGLRTPSKGEVFLNGRDIRKYKKAELRRRAQYIHQDPYSALDPYLSVGEVLERPLIYVKGKQDPDERKEIMTAILESMGLDGSMLAKSVHELSGGEKQRVLLARAFVIGPDYVVADEPTTMVDFVRREEILSLLSGLKEVTGTSVLLITHDISVASELSEKIAVMYKGEIVEYGATEEVIKNPLHPYTIALLYVTPKNLIRKEKLPIVTKAPSVLRDGDGQRCRYTSSCPYAFDKCHREHPILLEVGSGHKVACFKVTG